MHKLLIQLLFVFTQATALHAAEISQNSTSNPKQAVANIMNTLGTKLWH
jgi:hypothetical protein